MLHASATICDFHCPRWGELPSIPLYMDQVLLVVNETLQPLSSCDDTAITAAMINNYVKQKLIAPPIKKKYGRDQLSALIMVCVLKRVLSISEISSLLSSLSARGDAPRYDLFCGALEDSLSKGLEGGLSHMRAEDSIPAYTTLCAALIAFAGRFYVEHSLQAAPEA